MDLYTDHIQRINEHCFVTNYFVSIMEMVKVAGSVAEILKHQMILRNYHEWSIIKDLERGCRVVF
jgi:phosphoribosylaminoimidazole-succinocarboxamide synthase